MRNKLLTLSGPSCVGKTTIENHLVGGGFQKIISHTTREKREGEKHGVDYYFIDPREFETLLEQGKMAESALVHGNYYGVSVHELNAKLKIGNSVLVIDPEGLKHLRKNYDLERMLSVFLVPTSWEVLEERFIQRGGTLNAFLKRKENEVEWLFEAERRSDLYHFRIINDDLEKTISQILKKVV